MSPCGFLTSCWSKKTLFFLPKTLWQILKVLLKRSIAKEAMTPLSHGLGMTF